MLDESFTSPCTQHGSIISIAVKNDKWLMRDIEPTNKLSKSTDKNTLEVPRNNKTKGSHAQPFYRSGRW